MRARQALFDIVAALVLFLASAVLVAYLAGTVPAHLRLPVVVIAQGVALLVVVAILLARRGQSWRDIGLLAPQWLDIPRALIAFGACLGLNMLLVSTLHGFSPGLVEAHSERLGMIARQLTGGLTFAGLLGVLGFVGVYEEVFARGLLLARCRLLFAGAWLPVVASSLLFGLGHLYQGWLGVAQTSLIGLVLAVLTLRWGSLWPAIAAHALLDIFSVIVMREMA